MTQTSTEVIWRDESRRHIELLRRALRLMLANRGARSPGRKEAIAEAKAALKEAAWWER